MPRLARSSSRQTSWHARPMQHAPLRASTRAANDARYAFEPAVSADGVAIDILINIADPAELDGLDPRLCNGWAGAHRVAVRGSGAPR